MLDEIKEMGADAPIPPNTINAAAPEGTPPRRFEYFFERNSLKNALPREAPTRRLSDPIRGNIINDFCNRSYPHETVQNQET